VRLNKDSKGNLFFQQELSLKTDGHGHMQNLTDLLSSIVRNSGVRQGLLNVFNQGSTGAVGTIEFEPGLEKDLVEMLDRLIPPIAHYHHQDAWHDGNGHSTSRPRCWALPDRARGRGAMALGTWQQVIHLECDIKARKRTVLVHNRGRMSGPIGSHAEEPSRLSGWWWVPTCISRRASPIRWSPTPPLYVQQPGTGCHHVGRGDGWMYLPWVLKPLWSLWWT